MSPPDIPLFIELPTRPDQASRHRIEHISHDLLIATPSLGAAIASLAGESRILTLQLLENHGLTVEGILRERRTIDELLRAGFYRGIVTFCSSNRPGLPYLVSLEALKPSFRPIAEILEDGSLVHPFSQNGSLIHYASITRSPTTVKIADCESTTSAGCEKHDPPQDPDNHFIQGGYFLLRSKE